MRLKYERMFRLMTALFVLMLILIAGLAFLTGLSFSNSSFFYWFIATVVLATAGGALWFYFFVYRRNYCILLATSELLDEAFVPEPIRGVLPDTVDYIRSAVKELIDQASALRDYKQENHPLIKRYIFMTLLEGIYESSEQFYEHAMKIKLNFHGTDYLMSVVEIDDYATLCKTEDKQKLLAQRRMCRSTIQRSAIKQQYKIWTDWIDDCRLGVLFILEDPEQDESRVRDFYQGVRQQIKENLMFTVTVAVDSSYRGLDKIHQSYSATLNALSYKPGLGHDRVISVQDVSNTPQFDSTLWLHYVRHMSRQFLAGDSGWVESLEQLRSLSGHKLIQIEDLRMKFQILHDYVDLEMEQLHEDIRELWHAHKAVLKDQIYASETTDQMVTGYTERLAHLFEQIMHARETRQHRQLLQSIVEFIEVRCQQMDFSLAQVSEAFGLSQSYLSRVIKDGLNMRFIDFVTKLRMEKAKQMLLTSAELNVGDIAEKVGYLHAVTFIRAFKKYTGRTPGSFRREAF